MTTPYKEARKAKLAARGQQAPAPEEPEIVEEATEVVTKKRKKKAKKKTG